MALRTSAAAFPAHTSSMFAHGLCHPPDVFGQGQTPARGPYDRQYMGNADLDAREGVYAIYNNMPPAFSGTGDHVPAYHFVPDPALLGGCAFQMEPGTMRQELSSPAIAHNGQYLLGVPREPSGLAREGNHVSLLPPALKKTAPVPLVPQECLHSLSSYIDGKWSTIDFTFTAAITRDMEYDQEVNGYIIYRRNYMDVYCSVVFPSYGGDELVRWNSPETGAQLKVLAFGVGVSATSDKDNGSVVLNELTPQRRLGPIAEVEVKRLESDTQPGPTKKAHHFQRLQFRRSTKKNGKGPTAQEKFLLRASLYVKIDQGGGQESDWKRIGYNESPGLIVRGRAPCCFKPDESSSDAGMVPVPGSIASILS
ncbi:hypothetical protein AYO20_11400 [Fonsecaea nubica]|uniref:NDT80 domain-containing protein n=1 Tax=Fonsecaea nubica TaxID=856822 RepID=A0A178BWJ8_9EURO|nr:hypothetical protein AYO20_11400 [Fonsecaea nubica]OAL21282.1 hypothetical protein AYO20_11400 [Fonsecaea nubica]